MSVNVRPSSGETPRIGKNGASTVCMTISSGSPRPVKFARKSTIPAIASNDVLRSRHLMKFAGPSVLFLPGRCEPSSQSDTMRSGSRNGRRSSSTAFTIVKIAVLASMPSARARTAMMVKPGVRTHNRMA